MLVDTQDGAEVANARHPLSCANGVEVCKNAVGLNSAQFSCIGDWACENITSLSTGFKSCFGQYACSGAVDTSVGDRSCVGQWPCR